MVLPLIGFLLILGGAVLLLLSLVTCCAIQCFRPQNSRGPNWLTEQTVNVPFEKSEKLKEAPVPPEPLVPPVV